MTGPLHSISSVEWESYGSYSSVYFATQIRKNILSSVTTKRTISRRSFVSTPNERREWKPDCIKFCTANVSNEKKVIPWKAILTSVPVWALVFTQVGHDWGFFTMVTDLPKYMKEVLKFNVKENGLWSALPYVVMWIVSMISGWLCDFVINRGYMGRGVARKFFTTIGK